MLNDDFKDQLDILKDMLNKSSRVVFFGGAGVSTESGIPDFRSENGHFEAIRRFGYPPETLLDASFFKKNPDVFFEYYRSALLVTDVQPNAAHYTLARLEREGKLKAVITQNIDGLHTLAGSRNVVELHGSIYRNHCEKCSKSFDAEYMQRTCHVPRCDCGGVIKPDVVLYGETLNSDDIHRAISAISDADMLIVGGTSLSVYPAAGFIEYYRGDRLVLINKAATAYDGYANLVMHTPIGETLGAL